MRHGFFSEHFANDQQVITGGVSTGRGFTISWQNGALGKGNDRREPNGAFVEDIIDAARDRIDAFQRSGMSCDENAEALMHLTAALEALDRRTQRRQNQGTEGTHEGT